jgi:tetratricopeptide (TPR) repeat protein
MGVASLVAAASALAAQQNVPKPATLEELEARAHEDSLDAGAHFKLATRYYRLKRFDDEERELRATIAIDPRYAPAFLWLGDLPFDRRPRLWQERRKGKVPTALEPAVEESHRLWRRAFLIDPMADFRVIGAKAPPEGTFVVSDYGSGTTEYLLELGLSAFAVGRYELAYGAFQTWVGRAYPNQPPDSVPDFLFWYRGLSAAHQRGYRTAIQDQAVAEARRAIETNPDDPAAVLELGVILAEAGRSAEAEATLQQAARQRLTALPP